MQDAAIVGIVTSGVKIIVTLILIASLVANT